MSARSRARPWFSDRTEYRAALAEIALVHFDMVYGPFVEQRKPGWKLGVHMVIGPCTLHVPPSCAPGLKKS